MSMAGGAGRDDHSSLDSTIGTLKRCLRIVSGEADAGTSNSSEAVRLKFILYTIYNLSLLVLACSFIFLLMFCLTVK